MFSSPCILRPLPPLTGFPSNWVSSLWVIERWGYRTEKEVWRCFQPSRYNTRTWQTDGQTDTGRQQRARLRIASRVEWMNEWMNEWMLCKCCAHAVEQIHVKSTTNRKERNKLTVHIHVSRCCGFSCGHFNKSVTIRHNVVWVLHSPITYSSSGRMIWGIVSRGMLSISSSSGKPAVSAQVGGHV